MDVGTCSDTIAAIHCRSSLTSSHGPLKLSYLPLDTRWDEMGEVPGGEVAIVKWAHGHLYHEKVTVNLMRMLGSFMPVYEA